MDNPEEYVVAEKDVFQENNQHEKKYIGLNVYSNVTVKTCFKDYDVLCEEYEHKIMLQIYMMS